MHEEATSATGERWRVILRWLLIAIYLLAGALHVLKPEVFLRVVPEWVPLPRMTVIFTGLCEIAGAIGLIVPRLRWLAGLMLAIYAVCVYPANVKHALDYAHSGQGMIGWLYHGPRLAFQLVVVWWSLFVGTVVDWPFRRSQRQP